MAISYVSGSNTTYASRTNTTVTAPTGIADNDILLATIVTAASSEAPNPTFPSGFTEIGTAIDVSDSISFNLEMRVGIKVASGESGSYTFTHTSCSSQGHIEVFRGVDTSTPQDATSTSNATQGTGTRTWTGLTTATNGAWIVAIGADWGDTANNLTPPSGMTERLDVTLVYVATQEITTAGATGDKSHTSNTTYVSGWNPARLVALRPAGATAYTLTAAAGSHSLTGTAAGALQGRVTAAAAGSMALTGATAGTVLGHVVGAAAGSYALTGATASLVAGKAVSAGAGSLAITGADAGTLAGKAVSAASGSMAITGSDATLTKTGSYQVVAGAGSHAITGASAATLATRLVAVNSGSHAITGSAAGLNKGQTIQAAAGSHAVSGVVAAVLRGGWVQAEVGSIAILGTAASLVYSNEEFTPSTRSVTATGLSRVVAPTGEARIAAPTGLSRVASAGSRNRIA